MATCSISSAPPLHRHLCIALFFPFLTHSRWKHLRDIRTNWQQGTSTQAVGKKQVKGAAATAARCSCTSKQTQWLQGPRSPSPSPLFPFLRSCTDFFALTHVSSEEKAPSLPFSHLTPLSFPFSAPLSFLFVVVGVVVAYCVCPPQKKQQHRHIYPSQHNERETENERRRSFGWKGLERK